MAQPLTVDILGYTSCFGAQAFGISETLMLANRIVQADGGQAQFDASIIGISGRAIRTANGGQLRPRRPSRRPDLLIVPGLDLVRAEAYRKPLARLDNEIAFVRRTFSRGIPVASACTGSFILGEAGLLDGRRVTTAWAFAPALQQRFPRALVQRDALLVEDSGITTSGAFSAAFDLAMHIVRRKAGARIARSVSRLALVDAHRQSQAPFVDSRMMEEQVAGFSESVRSWLKLRLRETYELEKIANAFHVSPRTLLRRFKAETGQSPLTYLQALRVAKAKTLLESTANGMARITEEVGYADVGTFSGLFGRIVGLTPMQYRRRYRVRSA